MKPDMKPNKETSPFLFNIHHMVCIEEWRYTDARYTAPRYTAQYTEGIYSRQRS